VTITAQDLIVGAALLFNVSLMLSIGLATRPGILWPTIRRYRLIGRALVINVLLVPGVVLLAASLFAVPADIRAGLVIAAVSPGSPFVARVAQLARGNVPLATSLMVVLSVVAIVAIPIAALLLAPAETTASLVPVFAQLTLTQLFPLVLGILVAGAFPRIAQRLLRPLGLATLVGLVPLSLVLAIASMRSFVALIGNGLLVVAVCALVSYVPGLLLGGTEVHERRVMVLTAATRNVGIGASVASTVWPETSAAATVLVFNLLVLVFDFVLARRWQRLGPPYVPVEVIPPLRRDLVS
jgi:bile acid:Na+ symporter, BASS family